MGKDENQHPAALRRRGSQEVPDKIAAGRDRYIELPVEWEIDRLQGKLDWPLA